jgi:hypothetical protein
MQSREATRLAGVCESSNSFLKLGCPGPCRQRGREKIRTHEKRRESAIHHANRPEAGTVASPHARSTKKSQWCAPTGRDCNSGAKDKTRAKGTRGEASFSMKSHSEKRYRPHAHECTPTHSHSRVGPEAKPRSLDTRPTGTMQHTHTHTRQNKEKVGPRQSQRKASGTPGPGPCRAGRELADIGRHVTHHIL